MTGPKPVVLIVEDDQQTMQVMCTFAQNLGYRVRPATSGRAALDFARHTVPDLVLLDYLMPDLDGLTVCRELRLQRSFVDVPILFVSIIDDASDVVRCLEAGATDYIPKPVEYEVLRARMTLHLKAAQDRKLLKSQHEELTEAHARLRDLEQLRDSYAHMIVHDLRSPLAAINLTLDLLAVEGQSPRGLKLIDGALTACARAIRMTDSVLAASKLEATELQIAAQETDLAQWIETVLAGMPQLARHRQIEQQIPANLAVSIDVAMMSRVLENLLHNAHRFGPEGSVIHVEAETDPTGIWIAVEDHGPGIPVADRERVFERFHRIGKADGVGFGIGLASARLAVQAHGGTIEVVEARRGHGARVVIHLPNG